MRSILERTTSNRVFLFHGNINDMFMGDNLVPCDFLFFLTEFLKSIGFSHVVFYSPNDKGRFTLDEASAVYVKRAKGRLENQSPVQEPGGLGDDFSVWKKKKKKKNGSQDDMPDLVVPAEETPKAQVCYKHTEISLAEFLPMAQEYLSGTGKRTAVVFTNMGTFLNAPKPEGYHALLTEDWQRHSTDPDVGACIFLAPNCSAHEINAMLVTDRMPGLGEYFFDGGNRGGNAATIRYDRVIEVGAPEKDEIRNLLEYMRIVGYHYAQRKYYLYTDREELDQITDCIYQCSRDKKLQPRTRDLSQLAGIYDYLADYVYRICTKSNNLRANGIRFTMDEARILFMNSSNADGLSALERLHITGWEPVYNRMKTIVDLEKLRKERIANRVKNNGKTPIIVEVPEEEIGTETIPVKKPVCASKRIFPEYGEEENRPGEDEADVPSFVLRGRPGVGKTVAARLIGQVLKEAGILKTSKFIEVDRRKLVGEYIGQTERIMSDYIMDAEGGTLFIDEAYELFSGEDGGNGNDYGRRVLEALLPVMNKEDHTHQICVIMAGYPEKMDQLTRENDGILSRIGPDNNILIPDATPELMNEKFHDFIMREGYHIPAGEDGNEALPMDVYFENVYKRRNARTFGNYREVKRIAENVCGNAGLRDNPDNTIIKEDFGAEEKYFESTGPRTADEAIALLDQYVGMEPIKKEIMSIRDEEEINEAHRLEGIDYKENIKHFVFLGNPGTGKTQVGNLMGRLFYLLGILGAEETRVVDASELIGEHVGESARRTRTLIQDCIDNRQLLFVDEAYQIIKSSYGHEIMDAFHNPMTEYADQFRVVFAMYPEHEKEFLEMNRGLKRRLKIIRFADYTPDQLWEIFDRERQKINREITAEAAERVRMILELLYNSREKDFGNAAAAIDLVNEMEINRFRRVRSDPEGAEFMTSFILGDIPEEYLRKVESMVHPKTPEEIEAEINSMIGLQGLKEVMQEKRDEVTYAKKKGGSAIYHIEPGHYFFLGKPGTGKTTAAKMLAQYFYSIGVTKTDKFVSYSSKDLVGQYVGESDKKAFTMLERGRNGVIFIDEAHNLAVKYSDGTTPYEQQVLSQLGLFMEDEETRRTTCVILAGYEEKMAALFDPLSGDPGLLSRGRKVYFDDYSGDEAFCIFEMFAASEGLKIDPLVREQYTKLFEALSQRENYANGRTVRNIFNATFRRLKTRVVHQDEVDEKQSRTILVEDLLGFDEAMELMG